jgi:predicted protein tyrosine phosphatase
MTTKPRYRFLVVCDGGNVRSHGMAFVLKHYHNQEAVAVGRKFLSPESMWMFCMWADWIVIMETHMQESIPEEFHAKTLAADVGPDRYGVYVHPDLLKYVMDGAAWIQSITHFTSTAPTMVQQFVGEPQSEAVDRTI